MAKNILIIDDDPSIRSFYKEFLEEEGFKVYEAENAITGLKLYKELQPDIILLDINMPDKSGLDILKEIKKKDESTPIFLLTAHEDYKRNFSSLYADEYFVKGKNPEIILNRIKKYANKRIK
ncbi:response regulator [Deferribacter autotrophicus]|uniref:Response regulator n=1 Tax=Deferribacter autotrophicus TaxID=500465 RepID=A0A5A8F471_9BACT|nr:response regulator [Deferribacter autotrophicus]KAA0258688.1 response regulator [Deferribacter autotrophicus]